MFAHETYCPPPSRRMQISAFVAQNTCYNDKENNQQHSITRNSGKDIDHYASAREYLTDMY